MIEKRFRSENIKFSSFIVDLNSATSKETNIVKYKSYDTNTKKKCDELTDLLNRLNDENEQLKKELGDVIEICRKYGIYKEELKTVLYDYDKILKDNGERAIRYKYCVNGCCE